MFLSTLLGGGWSGGCPMSKQQVGGYAIRHQQKRGTVVKDDHLLPW